MKKRIFGRKLSRGSGARRALYRSLIRALVEHGSITTTKVKAKTIQRDVEKIVNIAKSDSVAARRRVYAKLGNDRRTTDKIFKLIVLKFSAKKGGYTRIINLPRRRGDFAEMARFEWTESIGVKDIRKGTTKARKDSGKTQKKGETQKGGLSKLASKIGRKRAK
jgi:large subunit ribosomal protein L17